MQPEKTMPNTPVEAKPTWQFTDDTTESPELDDRPKGDSISWTASEFIAHSKTMIWYLSLAGISILLAIILFLITRDIPTVVVIGVMAILFGYTASRKPRELPYAIDSKGLQIDKKLYAYSNFKSYSVVQEGNVESIWLLPLQRFSPGLSIYFAPSDKEKILNILSEYLPVEDRKLDLVDTFMHKIRF